MANATEDPHATTKADAAEPRLLAIDLGLRTGLALFGRDGRLRWTRSHNLGNRARLKRAAHNILADAGWPQVVVAEGDRAIGEAWLGEAARRGAQTRLIGAEVWRQRLLLPRERGSGAEAKAAAIRHARDVIAWSGAPRPPRLGHDAAEAILLGVWAALELGWLPTWPLPAPRTP